MDNFVKRLPIRNYKLADPIFVTFNIHLTQYNAYGVSQYKRLYSSLNNKGGAGIPSDRVYLLPNITSMSNRIEDRASNMAKHIKNMLQRTNSERCHLIAYSFAGVDARAAISIYGADEHVRSLSTISSPHLGMKALDYGIGYDHRGHFNQMSRVFDALGISRKNVVEYSTGNMKVFN